ncbi:MAG: N-acetylglucosamine kinase [Chitinophagaceae bacterium]|nr:N-acetylglucosamine kinase [Chitinophagaceae bacterium]MCW5929387.1 N-acetylglucosamine kinase [Chitinophagaceae bacterium]
MSSVKLIADSGATKAEWCILKNKRRKTIFTQGISPYFLNSQQIAEVLKKELLPQLKNYAIDEIFYYGTGCINPNNVKIVKKALQEVFTGATTVEVTHDVMAAAKALYGNGKGVACILGTGSSSCYYNGKKITDNRPGLGYVLGDEGSGAYLGKKVVQYFLYQTFDGELMDAFRQKFNIDKNGILENVYKKPLANRYLASFASFLSEHRGHYMIENILEDGINDFFFHHICKFKEAWTLPVSFVGGISHYFKDVILELCHAYEFTPGKILKNPMEGLVEYHQ